MPLEFTGLVVGKDNSALIVAPQSAYILAAQCVHGCNEVFYVAGATWVSDVDLASIFRSMEAGQRALLEARDRASGCLTEKGTTFDIKPLAGYVKA